MRVQSIAWANRFSLVTVANWNSRELNILVVSYGRNTHIMMTLCFFHVYRCSIYSHIYINNMTMRLDVYILFAFLRYRAASFPSKHNVHANERTKKNTLCHHQWSICVLFVLYRVNDFAYIDCIIWNVFIRWNRLIKDICRRAFFLRSQRYARVCFYILSKYVYLNSMNPTFLA